MHGHKRLKCEKTLGKTLKWYCCYLSIAFVVWWKYAKTSMWKCRSCEKLGIGEEFFITISNLRRESFKEKKILERFYKRKKIKVLRKCVRFKECFLLLNAYVIQQCSKIQLNESSELCAPWKVMNSIFATKTSASILLIPHCRLESTKISNLLQATLEFKLISCMNLTRIV